jgi:hypothetical protein
MVIILFEKTQYYIIYFPLSGERSAYKRGGAEEVTEATHIYFGP